jgi:serine/threonine protein kinase
MISERWQSVKGLFESALEREPKERAAFLDQACDGDESLRKEVESLLTSFEQSFMETPAVAAVAREVLADGRQAKLKAGETISHYKILSSLGAGGMGEVYLAQDLKLGRKVALKLLPAYLSGDGDRLSRFQQEARAASALSHANVCVVHEVGEAEGGRHYIVMEYVEGETLRDHMKDARLKLSEVLDVAVQVASALTAAHKVGVVHRDIKPENVILRPDGYVKVLDFGLAKLTERPAFATDSGVAARAQVKTNPGMVMGTVEYMSPEQARGKEVDARTDIWALGVMLYEMVTRRAPFEGQTPSHVIVSIIESEPPPLARYGEVPAELELIVNKALRKNKEERYQTAADLALDLKNLKEELEVEARLKRSLEPGSASSQATTTKSDGLAIDTITESAARTSDVGTARPTSSAEYLVSEIKRHKRGVSLVAVAALIVFAVVAYLYFPRNSAPSSSLDAIDSVAVLPFVNVSADPNTEYLSNGISESIMNSLSRLPALKVMSLNSVLRYKGKQIDSQAVGRELNVRAVLMGRFTQHGDDLAISTELVDTRDNRQLWGEQYDRKLSGIIVVQTEIAREISERLRLRLSGEEKKRPAKHYTENYDAYLAYLKGRYHLDKRTASENEKSIEYFQQAISLDPSYAPAYAGLSDSYWALAPFGRYPPKDVMPKAEAAARRAVELDDLLAEGHASLAHVLAYYDWDWAGAEKEFKRGIELDPNSPITHHFYSFYLSTVGRFDESLVEIKRALDLDPLSVFINRDVGMMLYYSRQYDQAIEQLQKTVELDPNFHTTYNWLVFAYEEKGLYDQAVATSLKHEEVVGRPENVAPLKSAYMRSGWKGFLQKELDLQKERAKHSRVASFAQLYARLGDNDRALAVLEREYEDRSPEMMGIKSEPIWDGLRSDPRFKELLRKMNFPP